MSSIFSFDIIRVIDHDTNIFLCIPASDADAAAVNRNGIETPLANGLSTFFIKANPIFTNRPRSLPRNSPDCTTLDN